MPVAVGIVAHALGALSLIVSNGPMKDHRNARPSRSRHRHPQLLRTLLDSRKASSSSALQPVHDKPSVALHDDRRVSAERRNSLRARQPAGRPRRRLPGGGNKIGWIDGMDDKQRARPFRFSVAEAESRRSNSPDRSGGAAASSARTPRASPRHLRRVLPDVDRSF